MSKMLVEIRSADNLFQSSLEVTPRSDGFIEVMLIAAVKKKPDSDGKMKCHALGVYLTPLQARQFAAAIEAAAIE